LLRTPRVLVVLHYRAFIYGVTLVRGARWLSWLAGAMMGPPPGEVRALRLLTRVLNVSGKPPRTSSTTRKSETVTWTSRRVRSRRTLGSELAIAWFEYTQGLGESFSRRAGFKEGHHVGWSLLHESPKAATVMAGSSKLWIAGRQGQVRMR